MVKDLMKIRFVQGTYAFGLSDNVLVEFVKDGREEWFNGKILMRDIRRGKYEVMS